MEVLSDRETDVVRLLAQALPNKTIASALSLSYETVKWHLKNIYVKLGVANRHEAIKRVRDLLPPRAGETHTAKSHQTARSERSDPRA